jgi:hypothetical protein
LNFRLEENPFSLKTLAPKNNLHFTQLGITIAIAKIVRPGAFLEERLPKNAPDAKGKGNTYSNRYGG